MPEEDGNQRGDRCRSFGASPVDMPFDRDLKRRFLGDDAPMAEPETDIAPEAAVDGTAPASSAVPVSNEGRRAGPGTELQPLGAWQRLKPAWRRHQVTATKLRELSPNVKDATDILRTRLLQKLKTEGWTRVAVTAPASGCGTTFMTLNLALSISAIPDLKTVLLDLNQRNPGLAKALDSTCALRIAGLLGGQVPALEYLQRHADNLAVGLNADTPPNPAELLQSRSAAEALGDIDDTLAPDVVLCDMPPLLEHDDTLAFLPRVDAVLLVADGTKSLATQIAECETLLEGRAPLLGVVLNRGRGPQ